MPRSVSVPTSLNGPSAPPSTASHCSPSGLNHRRGRTWPHALSPPATRMPPFPDATANAHCSWSPPRASAFTRVHLPSTHRQIAASPAAPCPTEPTATRPALVDAIPLIASLTDESAGGTSWRLHREPSSELHT